MLFMLELMLYVMLQVMLKRDNTCYATVNCTEVDHQFDAPVILQWE
jgi:hypothetical protein